MSAIELESIDTILKSINSAIRGKKLYPAGHPAIAAPMTKSYQTLSELLRARNKIFIGMAKDVLVFEENPIMDGDKNLGEFIHRLKQKEIEGIIFEKGLLQKEFFSFIDILLIDDMLKGRELQQMLASKNILHISIKSLQTGRNILETYQDAVAAVRETMNQVRMGKVPKTWDMLTKVVSGMTELVLSDKNAMIGLTMIKNYDGYLFNHSVNVSILSIAIAQSMNHQKADLHTIGIAGLLHDVGKTGVTEDIIKKPGILSSSEWDTVKEHPVLGSKIIERMEGMTALISRLVYEHHMRYDRSGYPHTELPLHPLSMIITTADAYDALTTLRVYQKPYHPVEAIKIMNNLSGKHFEPNTLKSFVAMVGLYPIGTLIRLSTNEIGIVTKISPSGNLSPVVKVIVGADGKQADKSYEIDLSVGGKNAPTIAAPVDPLTKGLDIGKFFEEEAQAATL
ncbi:MAG: HD domain-containing protein [Deltaproteobacteria bacterium]|nr:HD domain-containing protein [Deltaproteobacteria bacterium]